MSDGLRLQVNGRQRVLETISGPAMLSEVLAAMGLRADRIAVELNGELAPRTGWQSTAVREGDRLEIVHFVGGGSAS